MLSIWSQLRRRNVVKVALAYAIVAWLIVQIVVNIKVPLNLPEWSDSLVIVLLAVGFIVALLLAWAYELTPQGVKRTKSVPFSESVASMTGRKLDFVIIGALSVTLAFVFTMNVISAPDGESPTVTSGLSDETDVPSIAVLPFVDISAGQNQAYIGDGVAYEVWTSLSDLNGVNVVSTTSSFSFRDSDADVTTIGARLGVDWILEGSVRVFGEDLFVTAALINPGNGFRQWSENYDGQMTDIFEVEREIAASVAGELGVRLGVGGANAFPGAGTQNIEAYEAFLRARSDGLPLLERIELLERAIELDPDYAGAWATLGVLRGGNRMWESLPEEAPALIEEGYRLLEHAVELDPASYQAQLSFGVLRYAKHEWLEAEQNFRNSLSLREDSDTLRNYGNMLARAGRSAAARSQYERADAIDPLADGDLAYKFQVNLAEGRLDDARAILTRRGSSVGTMDNELHIAFNSNDKDELIAAMTRAAASSQYLPQSTFFSSLLEIFDSPEMVMSRLRAAHADATLQWPSKLHDIAMLSAFLGDPEFALDVKGEEVRLTSIRNFSLWYPVMADVRQLPAFKVLMGDIGLVDYWRAYGWADACRPISEDDFACR